MGLVPKSNLAIASSFNSFNLLYSNFKIRTRNQIYIIYTLA